jgi:hypothetical protein
MPAGKTEMIDRLRPKLAKQIASKVAPSFIQNMFKKAVDHPP